MKHAQNNVKPHQIMLWEKVQYDKAVQKDEGKGGAILEGEARKGLSVEMIVQERPESNEGQSSPVDIGAGIPGRGKRGDNETLKD